MSKCNKKTAILLLVGVMAVFFVSLFFGERALAAQAQDTFGIGYASATGLGGNQDIRLTIAKIIRVLLGLLGTAALGLVLYAGYTIMTAGGNDEKVTQGKKILINGLIGIAIILSAFAIVQFIIRQLASATGFRGPFNGGGSGEIVFDSFSGSGALGRIVKDHYPFRDDINIKRNTRIVVTFREAIDPASLIMDTNNNGILGDCLDVTPLDWEVDCDRLKGDVVQIMKVLSEDQALPQDQREQPVDAAVLALYEGDEQKAYTFVFRPLALLGSAEQNMWHRVRLTNAILKADGVAAFENQRTHYYEWKFQTDTLLDETPPHVQSVSPEDGETAFRNSIIQVNFSEAMDPTVVQGMLRDGGAFTNLIFSKELGGRVDGEWKITNRYKSVEFLSNLACGQNSCGQTMYCLPTGCPENDLNCQEGYLSLIRTANTVGDGFEAFPFSGVTDMSGNALDGDDNGNFDGKPDIGNPALIGENEKAADNYFWNFRIRNQIDKTSPYIEKVTPGIDAEDVSGLDPVVITYSKAMWLSTLSNMDIEEYGSDQQRQALSNMDELWFIPESGIVNTLEDDWLKTQTTLRHRLFGPNGMDLFYFPALSSEIKGINQNCLYPGRGPYSNLSGDSPNCVYEENNDGNEVLNQNCTRPTFEPEADTSCVETVTPTGFAANPPDTDAILTSSTESCLQRLRDISNQLLEPAG